MFQDLYKTKTHNISLIAVLLDLLVLIASGCEDGSQIPQVLDGVQDWFRQGGCLFFVLFAIVYEAKLVS